MDLLRMFTVRTRMIGAIALVLAIVAGIGAVGLAGLKQGERLGTGFVQKEFAVAFMLGDVREGMSHLRRHEKDVILNLQNAKDGSHHKQLWDKANKVTDQGLSELESRLSSADQNAIRNVRQHLEEYRIRFGNVYKQIDEGFSGTTEAAAALMSRADAPFLEAETALGDLSQRVQAHGVRAAGAFHEMSNQLSIFLAVALAAAVVLVVPLTLLNMRSICAPLDHGVSLAREVARGELTHSIEVHGKDELSALMQELETMRLGLAGIVSQVRSSAAEIGVISKDVSGGSSDMNHRVDQQSIALQNTVISMDQLTTTVKQNAESVQQANTLARAASDVAVKGGAVVTHVVDTMSAINESSRKIVDIIGVIDSIAFQTNILALNAAVEAARAGEQGRGFAVVAAEVRSLAQRSAGAAKEIKELISGSMDNVNAGTKLVDQAGATMNEIVASVNRVTDIMVEITAAGNEQSAGIEDINKAISLIDESTRSNASLVEHIASAALRMQDQAACLSQAISVFKIADGAETREKNSPRLPGKSRMPVLLAAR